MDIVGESDNESTDSVDNHWARKWTEPFGVRLRCSVCKKPDKGWGKLTSVTAISKHMARHHPSKIPKSVNPEKKSRTHQTDISSFTTSRPSRKEGLATHKRVSEWINQTGLPTSVLRHEALRTLFEGGIPVGYLPPSPQMLKKLQVEEEMKIKKACQETLSKRALAGCITADGWTSESGVSYFGVLLHYVDLSTFMQTPILLAVVEKKSQTALDLEKAIRDIFKDWDMEDQTTLPVEQRWIRYFVSDTTSVMPKTACLLGFKWLPCMAHVLQLVVNAGLRQVTSLISRHKKIVKVTKQSSSARAILEREQKASKLPTLKLIQSTYIRWGSVFRMLQRNLSNKHPIDLMLLGKGDVTLYLSAEDWDFTSDIMKLLEPFERTTTAIQSRHEPTLSWIIPTIKKIEKELNILSLSSSKAEVMRTTLLAQLSLRFSKIYSDCPEYVIASVLNPFTKAVLNNYGVEFQKSITSELQRLININEQLSLEKSGESEDENSVPGFTSSLPWHLTEVPTTPLLEQTKDLIIEWMELPGPGPLTPVNAFWQTCDSKFLPIRRLYCLYNHLPSTSAEVERVWSKCGYLSSKLRNSIKSDTLARRIFLEKNRPFVKYSGDLSNHALVLESQRMCSPLSLDFSLTNLEKAKVIVPYVKPAVDSTVVQDPYTVIDDTALVDSDSESEISDDEGISTEEPIHPAELHFRISEAPRNFWNQLSQIEEVDKVDYELKSPSSNSNKRTALNTLPRSSKRLKTLWDKVRPLKLETRIRVWWTEVDIPTPTWFVGTITKLYNEKNIFRIVYDHELQTAHSAAQKKMAAKGWKHDLVKECWEILTAEEEGKTTWAPPK